MNVKRPPPDEAWRLRVPTLARSLRPWLLAGLCTAAAHWSVLDAWDMPRLRRPEAPAPGLTQRWMELVPVRAVAQPQPAPNAEPVPAPVRRPMATPRPAPASLAPAAPRAQPADNNTPGREIGAPSSPATFSTATAAAVETTSGPSAGAMPRYPAQAPGAFTLPLVVSRGARRPVGPLELTAGDPPASSPDAAQRPHGQGELRYIPTADGRYQLDLALQIEGQAVLRMSSQGQVSADGLAPERFIDRRQGRGAAAANFDREAQQARFSGGGAAVPLSAAAQDRLSWLVQLPAVVRADLGLQRSGAQVLLQVVGARGGMQVWRFEALGQQPLKLPDGQYWPAAWRWRRLAEQPYDLEVEVWLEPQQLTPVGVRLTPVPGGRPLEFWPARGAVQAGPGDPTAGGSRP